MKQFLCLFAILFAFSFQSFAQSSADDLIGVWEPSHGKGRVKVEKIGDKYYGKVVWIKEPIDPETGQKKLDKSNPDPALRSRPRLGLRVLKDFTFSGKGVWEKGTIYDPENGSTYNCTITMKDKNTLDIRGYIGVSVFGRTDVWKRVK
ncbi:MAG: DUF2147 domain-containing protein [Bacteroidia bacterium]|nr:DUF2147 domain-containing protein [Bacteroidia bacterium]